MEALNSTLITAKLSGVLATPFESPRITGFIDGKRLDMGPIGAFLTV